MRKLRPPKLFGEPMNQHDDEGTSWGLYPALIIWQKPMMKRWYARHGDTQVRKTWGYAQRRSAIRVLEQHVARIAARLTKLVRSKVKR